MNILLAIVCIMLGLSFAYKAVLAIFLGRTQVWTGFLPITLISPLFIHLPAGKNSLIRTSHGIWNHFILGPLFFFISVVLFATGADQLGLPGAEAVNYVFTLGKVGAAPAITFDRQRGYSFPIFKRAGDALIKSLTAGIKKEDK